MPEGQTSTELRQSLEALQGATLAFTGAEGDSEQTLRLALEPLMRVTGADAGAVAVLDADRVPEILAARFLDGAETISRTVLETVLRDDGSSEVLVTDPPGSHSVFAARITSILCAPGRRRDRTLAAVYLDRRGKAPFDEVARALAVCFASILALRLDLLLRAEQSEQQAEEARAAAAHLQGYWRLGSITTTSRLYAECLRLAERAADVDSTLLLLGETGSGKEHLARCIHEAAARRRGAFIPVNCAAVPEALLESELFGHERGAFTGALQTRRGKFELADGGTLFLDEVGEMPLGMQPKLLRAIEDKTITRVGGSEPRRVDVRILVATHRDLAAEVRAGRFREDLYYRLAVIVVKIPPLRLRPEDIPELARTFLQTRARTLGRQLDFQDGALLSLSRHPWPGNVRELRNAIERLCILAPGPVITAEDVARHALAAEALADARPDPSALHAAQPPPSELQDLRRAVDELRALVQPATVISAGPPDRPHSPLTSPQTADPKPLDSFQAHMDQAAREVIQQALRQTKSIAAAARLLGMTRQNLSLKCKQLGLRGT